MYHAIFTYAYAYLTHADPYLSVGIAVGATVGMVVGDMVGSRVGFIEGANDGLVLWFPPAHGDRLPYDWLTSPPKHDA